MLRLGLIFASVLWAASMRGVAASDLGLVLQTNWFGEPCLLTNPPGDASSSSRVVLVVNPLLAANRDYQTKLSALVTGEMHGLPDKTLAALFHSLKQAGFQQTNLPAGGRNIPLLARFEPSPAPNSGEKENSWGPWIDRWALFILVMLFLARRGWRYFHETEDDDDFADRLATLAVAHRWIFPVYLALLMVVALMEYVQIGNLLFSVSVLMLASSLRRYYCEAHFADNPGAQKIHLALRCLLIWLGWIQGQGPYLSDAAAWFHWHVLAWVVLALATTAFSQFYNHPDLSEHRPALYWFGGGFLLLGLLGGAGGFCFWRETALNGSAIWLCLASGAVFAWSPLLGFFWQWNKKVGDQMAGRMIFDVLFSEAAFAEKPRRKKRLPHLLLLRHWRDRGEMEKAWHAAQTHLLKDARALPVWLFALETAVLYRRKPDDALQILGRLCASEEFSHDQRAVAVAQVQGWMAAAGFPFDSARFKIELPPLQPTRLTGQVEQKCREGRFGEAALLLRKTLEQDCLNEQAFVQLVRLYAQDLKNRPTAQRLIDDARETFSPKLLDFLSRSLDEWIKLPIRSQVRRRTWLDRLLGKKPEKAVSKKIAFATPPIALPPAPSDTTDPVTAHLERVKEAQGKAPDASTVQDSVERLLSERRLGTAVETLKQQAEAQPGNFELWLRYAEAHGHHCGNVHTAQKIIERMEQSRRFKKAEMRKAYTRLKKWRKEHPVKHANW